MFACILECKVQFVPRILLHSSRHTDATRERSVSSRAAMLRHRHKCDFLNDNVAHVDTHAKLNPFILKYVGIARGHTALNSTAQRTASITLRNSTSSRRRCNDPSTVFGDFGFDERAKMVLQLDVCALLVAAHEPAVSGHISREDGGQPSLQSLVAQSTPPA